ncbi:MAG: T9SS type A sorting domain-containing protein [Flavobacteriales bacterium]|nr:MAG: T9SS type A sorting domain-containing protein [Flavobacteriales bacterium]
MKTPLLLAALIAATTVAAQTSVTVTTGPGNAQQTWYNLNTDATTSAPLAEWDLAFEINGGFNAGIMANTAKGVKVYQAPVAVGDWGSMDTTGMAANWQGLHNSDKDWSLGAFNSDVDLDAYNIGWGIYNTVTHVVAGDSIQVVVLADGAARMIRIDALGAGTYTFTYANLDGSDEQTHQIAKADYSGKNYAYWSMTSHSAIDREPMSADWDILFGKYTTNIGTWYGVTGALHNKNVQAVQVGGVPTLDAVFQWNDLGNDINILGHDWKYFDMGTFQYVIEDSLTYFVKDVTGNVWKMWFTGFGGSTTGDISFNKQLISAASVGEVTNSTVVALYPNPTSNGQVNVVMDGFNGTTRLLLTDLNGKLVRQQSSNQGGVLSNIAFDVNGVEAGIYLLRVDDGATNAVQRLVVQ